MDLLQVSALVVTLTALFSYLNFRFLRQPTTIGVMLIALVLSVAFIGIGTFEPELARKAERILKSVDFDQTLLQGMLSFLLFAGALQINLNDLAEQKTIVTILAIGGVVISLLVFGFLIHFVGAGLGLTLSYAWCFLFGALISPTDPVAVLSILKIAKVPKSLEIQIAGESLFNDGIGVVAFLVCSEIATAGQGISGGHIGGLFLKEAVGGAAFGLITGWITFLLLRSVDNYQVEVLLTLALVMGGYSLASALHLSGPIAIVVAGLLIGNHGRRFAMSVRTREHLDTFWELVDEIFNAILFVLIGLEVLVVSFTRQLLTAGLLGIPAILLARWISVAVPMTIMRRYRTFIPGSIRILTWGGLRGGISVALALSLPSGPERDQIVVLTYVIVVFSIVFQGLTVRKLVLSLLNSGAR